MHCFCLNLFHVVRWLRNCFVINAMWMARNVIWSNSWCKKNQEAAKTQKMCFFEPTKSKYLYLTVSNMFHANSSKVEQAAKSWIEFNFESPFNFVFIPFMSFAWLETFLVMLTQHWGEKSSRMNWLEMKISLTYKKVKEPSCTVMLKPFYPANYLSKLVIPILNRS